MMHARLRWAWGILVLLLLVHLLQIASPLRLNTDAEHFLNCAATAAESSQAFPLASSKPHPPGYATLLAVMERAHFASAPALALVNWFNVTVGVLCAYGLLWRGLRLAKTEALAICAATLLSFVLVKHAVIPLSDLPFFGSAMACLYCLVRAEQASEGRWGWLMAGVALALLALLFRTIGVALFPAVLWAVCGKRKKLALGLLIGGGLLGAAVLSQTAYAAYAIRQFASGDAWGAIGQARLREFGELGLNFPSARLPGSLAWVIWLAGLATLAIVGWGITRWRSGGLLEVFALSFAGVLAVWPFEDARFWLPVLPVLFALALVGMGHLPQSIPRAWGAWFAITGLAALAFSTRLTFSGSEFAERYGDGSQRGAYRVALGKAPGTEEVSPAILALLRRHEPRAR